jgi:hypothetical protein
VKNSPASAFARAARKLEQAADELDPAQAWLKQDGLCALLQAAKLLPQPDPADLDALPPTSFTALLIEARQPPPPQEGQA